MPRHLPYYQRWREQGGTGIGYIRRPFLRHVHYLITAAGVPLELARHRLGEPALAELHPDVRFLHEGSEICIIRSSAGAASHFRRNMPQILFAAAQLIAKLGAQKKRSASTVFCEVSRRPAR